jgi:endonuclease YncB( thermonuclease family)
MPGGERLLAVEAAAFLDTLLTAGTPVQLTGIKADKFGGRYDSVVLLDGKSLNLLLIEKGYAAPYDGKGARKNWCAALRH